MTKIIGILNLSPESFSGDGVVLREEALRRAEEMVAQGVDVIDVGGQSTRPLAIPLTAEQEISRVQGVIRAIRKTCPDVPIAIDTTKSEVAKMALEEGATIINDISGGRFDERIFPLIANTGAQYILGHSQGSFVQMHEHYHYTDVIQELELYFRERIDRCMRKGVAREQIIIDPGIGFSKSEQENRSILQELPRIQGFGFPLCIGLSRKRFIGKWVAEDVAKKRDNATTALHAHCCMHDVEYLRTHNVRALWECREVLANIG
jgi:dihydropteroate synthase